MHNSFTGGKRMLHSFKMPEFATNYRAFAVEMKHYRGHSTSCVHVRCFSCDIASSISRLRIASSESATYHKKHSMLKPFQSGLTWKTLPNTFPDGSEIQSANHQATVRPTHREKLYRRYLIKFHFGDKKTTTPFSVVPDPLTWKHHLVMKLFRRVASPWAPLGEQAENK